MSVGSCIRKMALLAMWRMQWRRKLEKKNSLGGYRNCLYISKLDPEINSDLGIEKKKSEKNKLKINTLFVVILH